MKNHDRFQAHFVCAAVGDVPGGHQMGGARPGHSGTAAGLRGGGQPPELVRRPRHVLDVALVAPDRRRGQKGDCVRGAVRSGRLVGRRRLHRPAQLGQGARAAGARGAAHEQRERQVVALSRGHAQQEARHHAVQEGRLPRRRRLPGAHHARRLLALLLRQPPQQVSHWRFDFN
jgi:hypothetical protein